jgi:hypothetical protein
MESDSKLKVVQDDILIYKKNKLASTFAILGLVFNCLYFCLLYGFTNVYFSTIKLGISVIVTLVTLLVTFLASESIKNYKKQYVIVLCVLAAVQILRIFGIPLEALNNDVANGTTAFTTRYFGVSISSQVSFTLCVIYLVASAACLITSAVIGYIQIVKLERHRSMVESGQISVDEVLKELNAEDEANAQVESQPVNGQEV